MGQTQSGVSRSLDLMIDRVPTGNISAVENYVASPSVSVTTSSLRKLPGMDSLIPNSNRHGGTFSVDVAIAKKKRTKMYYGDTMIIGYRFCDFCSDFMRCVICDLQCAEC